MHTMYSRKYAGANKLQTICYIEILKALGFRCRRHDIGCDDWSNR